MIKKYWKKFRVRAYYRKIPGIRKEYFKYLFWLKQANIFKAQPITVG